MNDLVSVIMPSYNTADNIEEAINSVIEQTYSNWELIIVDDCSTDNTNSIISKFNDNRIKYYKNPTNCGAAISRNKALREASGRWIAFLDSDDLWKKDKLSKQISFMEKNHYAFSYTKYEEIDEKGNSLFKIISGPKRITKRMMFLFCWPGCLTVMYDASVVGCIQIKNIKKNNDYAMWLQVCKKADCNLLEESLAYYRRGRKGSISTHSVLTMTLWHYRLFRIVENMNPIESAYSTGKNLMFGLLKKIVYTRRIPS